MDNYMWFLAVLLTIGQRFDNASAHCNPPNPPCTNCTSQPQLDSFPVTSYLTWTCTDGFIMEGDGNSIIWVCTFKSTWLGDTPNCTEITCSSPPIPANGMIDNDGTFATYKPGDSIQYSCVSGYDLISNETFSTCLPNGTWTHEEQFCKIDCGDKISYEEGNTCFQVKSNDVNWTNAKAKCEDGNGMLALVKNNDTHTFLRSNLTLSDKLWIGGKEERHWKWANSKLSIFRLFWNYGEPNNFNNEEENCIEMVISPQAGWNDRNCNIQNGLICQYETMAENLGNANSHQVFYRGNRYKFFKEGCTWQQAKDKCGEENGFLVEVFDRSTQDFVSNEAANFVGNGTKWWIGGYADLEATDRSWFWVDNTRILQFQWRHSEPSGIDEKCIEMWKSKDQKWNDESCSSGRHYVCQFGLPSCEDPGEPLQGSRTPSDTSTFLDGATIEYHCDPGYEVIGNTSATCMLNGRWDSERPVCKAITCPNELPAVADAANMTVSSQTYRGVATYTCTPGYFPDASPVSYCLADGTWSHPNFICAALPQCYSEPCQNGATCSDINDTFTCDCADGFTGIQCETDPQPQVNIHPQPQVNIPAIAGGTASVFLVILLVLAVLLIRKRRKPNSKSTQEMSLENERGLKTNGNNYHIKDNAKPVVITVGDACMIDNDVYAPSPDDATYQEVEEKDQEAIYEEDFRYDGDKDGMIDNVLHSSSGITDQVGSHGNKVYENTEYHDVPDNLVDNELYNM